ncbi:MAG: type II toxin-antitoxin system RelE/ParE family toxin [Candidatus Aminicenantes bacterium]|nr:type II toxin-antitoxin system RelE/ParE family toxin [Candidatus Aminicenantes bacterium]
MIKSWKHKGLKELFLKGVHKRVRPDMADRIRRRLDVLDAADTLQALGLPGFRLHPLSGDMSQRYSIRVTGNWRITFRFEKGDIFDVNLEDYHGK